MQPQHRTQHCHIGIKVFGSTIPESVGVYTDKPTGPAHRNYCGFSKVTERDGDLDEAQGYHLCEKPASPKCLRLQVCRPVIAGRYSYCAYENLDHRGGNGSDSTGAHAPCTYS